MDEGAPIAYDVLEEGVAVIASDGEPVGKVRRVIAASAQDIFHGLIVDVDGVGAKFVSAERIAALHERAVELSIASGAVGQLPDPAGDAPVYDSDLADMKGWRHWARLLSLRDDWRRRD